MTDPAYAYVIGDYVPIVADLASDSDAKPQKGAISATVTVTPILQSGDAILATGASPRPTGFLPTSIVGRIDTDGIVKLRVDPDEGSTHGYPYQPMMILCDTPLLELDGPLFYRVTFSNVIFGGKPGMINSFEFQAPTVDGEVVNLITVGRVPGQPAPGITRGPVGASGETGATGATGATGPAASWSVITDRPGPLVALGGRVTVDQLLDRGEPIILPHRGAGANLAPESTMTAWRVGAALGLGIVDGGDWRTTKDNTLVCCHNATTDYSTRVRTPSDMSAMEAAQMKIAASTWFGGGHADSVAATAEEVFGTFGGSVVLCPEAKDAGSVPLLVDLVQRMGLQESVLPNAFDPAFLTPFVDAGCPHVLLSLTGMRGDVTRAGDQSNGINWYGVPWNGSITVANVETLLAEGFQVMLYTLQRACQLTQVHDWDSIKSDLHYYSDDPIYFRHALDSAAASTYRRTTDPFGTLTWYHGHIATPTDGAFHPIYRGEFRGVKRWGMLPDTVGRYVLAGWASPLTSPTTWTVDFNLTFDAMGSDSNRWAGIVACATNDQGWADSANAWHNGYLCYFRRSGQLNVARHTAGSSGSASSSSTQSVRDPLVTTSTLAAGVAITSIPCTAIASSIQAGLKFRLPNDQIATVATGGASASATSVPVDSITPTTTVPSGSSLPQTVPLRIAVTSTTITFSRHDSVGGTVTVTDNTHRGPYLYLGQNSASAGLSTSFSEMSIT